MKSEGPSDKLCPGRVFVSHTHELLTAAGYRLVDDAWEKHGRYTFLHEDDASTGYVRSLNRMLAQEGWTMDAGKLRTFQHHRSGHEIELEPGGSEVTGHFLHHMKLIPTN